MTHLGRYPIQRNWGCRVREYTYHGLSLVVLENERLRVGVLAGKGTDVVEFNDKRRDLDFAWLTAGGVRNPLDAAWATADPVSAFLDTYPGGWQEIFPNGGAPSTVLGVGFGQHDEVATVPWDARLVEDTEEAVAVAFAVRTRKTPFLVEKELRLVRGEATLHLRETITNESDVPLPAMWGHHLAFGRPFLDETCRIRLPDGVRIVPHPGPIDPDGRRVVPDQRPPWPIATGADGGDLDLSRLPPRGTVSDIVYLTEFPDATAWYEVVHPERGVGFRVEWDATVLPYLWYWQEFGASLAAPWYGRHYNVGLEPFSSYPTNGLAEAVANGTALTFGPRERKSLWLRASVVEDKP